MICKNDVTIKTYKVSICINMWINDNSRINS